MRRHRLAWSSLSATWGAHLALAFGTSLTATGWAHLCLSIAASGAGWTHWAIFLFGDLSIGILVELLQGLGSLGDFHGINDAVVIGVEGLNKGRYRARSTRSFRSVGTWVRWWLWWRVLGEERQRGGTEAQRDEDACWFHDRWLWISSWVPVGESHVRSLVETR